MGGVGITDMLIPTDTRNPRSRFIKTLLRLLQSGFMFTYVQLNADSSYERFVHKRNVAQEFMEIKEKCAITPIFSSLGLKPRVSENGGF